jgi:DNA polymerase I-like protein with 3'-5' exonuclease and polymerase domains
MKKLLKVRDTYLEAFYREQVNGWIHPFYNLHLARSYRSSSDHPNWQNIPSHEEEMMQICRRAILPRKGHMIVEVDYSGVEVRTSVSVHKDPVMLKYVTDKTTDMHRDMAIQLFKLAKFDKKLSPHKTLRKASKNGFVFPEFYGDWWQSCAKNLACNWGELPSIGNWQPGQGIDMPEGKLSDHMIKVGFRSLESFAEHVKKVEDDFWNNRFRVYQQWKDSAWEQYQKNGYLDMVTGFRCSGVMNRKQVGNSPIQGPAFHCLLWSFTTLDRIAYELEKWDSRLTGQIHDCLLVDVNPNELNHVIETIQRVTCDELVKAWPWIITPMEVEIESCEVDESWDKKKAFEAAA